MRGIGDQRQRSGQDAANPLDGDEQRIERDADGKGAARAGAIRSSLLLHLGNLAAAGGEYAPYIALVTIGVLMHLPMYILSAPAGYHLCGMDMDLTMWVGIGSIIVGTGLSWFALIRPVVPGAEARLAEAPALLAKTLFEDLVAAGVIDPTKVARTALENAVSIVGTILTTEVLVSDMRLNAVLTFSFPEIFDTAARPPR